MDITQIVIFLCSIIIFAALGYGMHRSIKQHDAKQQKIKKKKGKNKYMPEAKNPGR